MNVTKFDKIVKWVAYAIEAAMVITIIALGIAVGHKNAKIKEYKAALEMQCAVTDSLQHTVADLWGMDCIKVDVICNIQQKGVVNLQNSTQVAKSVATYTRGEVLMAMDSLQRVNNEK